MKPILYFCVAPGTVSEFVGVYFIKTVLPSYMPPPRALPREARFEFEWTMNAAMLRAAVCALPALRECFRECRAS
jgi:hypothetical protein